MKLLKRTLTALAVCLAACSLTTAAAAARPTAAAPAVHSVTVKFKAHKASGETTVVEGSLYYSTSSGYLNVWSLGSTVYNTARQSTWLFIQGPSGFTAGGTNPASGWGNLVDDSETFVRNGLAHGSYTLRTSWTFLRDQPLIVGGVSPSNLGSCSVQPNTVVCVADVTLNGI